MDFIQGLDYKLELNLHSKTMLAFRYGIVEDGPWILAYFLKDMGRVSEDRMKCRFNINGQKVILIVQKQILITALPSTAIFETPDASAVATSFDVALQLEPSLFTMQEIADWREDYVNSNGRISKDDLRREIKTRAPDYRSPMELLGLPDNFFEEVREIREIIYLTQLEKALKAAKSIDFLDDKAANSIDFLDDEDNEFERVTKLAYSEETLRFNETEGYAEARRLETERWLESDEYKAELQEAHDSQMAELLLEELERGEESQARWEQYQRSEGFAALSGFEQAQKKKAFAKHMARHNHVWLNRQRALVEEKDRWSRYQRTEAYESLNNDEKKEEHKRHQGSLNNIYPLTNLSPRTAGMPPTGAPSVGYDGRTIFKHPDCEVTDVHIAEHHNDWNYIHFQNDHGRFSLTTRHKFIAESYVDRIGKKGVWAIIWDNGTPYLQTFGGSSDQLPDFYHSQEWLKVRFRILKRSKGRCELCGSNQSPLEVDHIKPRSLYPELAIDESNLQVLCKACNSGKSNRDETDFRN